MLVSDLLGLIPLALLVEASSPLRLPSVSEVDVESSINGSRLSSCNDFALVKLPRLFVIFVFVISRTSFRSADLDRSSTFSFEFSCLVGSFGLINCDPLLSSYASDKLLSEPDALTGALIKEIRFYINQRYCW